MKYDKLIKGSNVGVLLKNGSANVEAYLSGSFLYGITGVAYSWYFQAYETENITGIGAVFSTFLGTPGMSYFLTGTDAKLNIELRKNTSSSNAGELIGSGLLPVPSGTSNQYGWITGAANIPLEKGKVYHLCVTDYDANPSGYVRMMMLGGGDSPDPIIGRGYGLSTTNGWISSTPRSAPPPMYFLTDKGNIRGGSIFYSFTTTFPNTTGYRGTILRPNMRLMLTQIGTQENLGAFVFNSTGVWSLNIFDNTTSPTGVPLKTITPTLQDGAYYANDTLDFYTLKEDDRFVFEPDKTYRVVWKPSSSSASPRISMFWNNTPSFISAAETITDGYFSIFGTTYQNTGTNLWIDNHTNYCTNLGMMFSPLTGPTICS